MSLPAPTAATSSATPAAGHASRIRSRIAGSVSKQVSPSPAAARCPAIGYPITPRPMKPTLRLSPGLTLLRACSCVAQCGGETAQHFDRGGGRPVRDGLDAHVIGSHVEVLADPPPDRRVVTPRNDRIDQRVGTSVDQVVVGVARASGGSRRSSVRRGRSSTCGSWPAAGLRPDRARARRPVRARAGGPARESGAPVRLRSTGTKYGWAPSAALAASSSIFGRSAAITVGTRWEGAGEGSSSDPSARGSCA